MLKKMKFTRKVILSVPLLLLIHVNEAFSKPADFELYSPSDSVIVRNPKPTLEWNDTSDGESFTFTVYYSTKSNFIPKITESGILSNTTTYAVPSNLIENATYWWNVYAVNLAGQRTYASTETFIVDTINDGDPTGCPLMAPIDNVVELTNKSTFYWSKAIDPDPGDIFWYKPMVSHDPEFQDNVAPGGPNQGWFYNTYKWFIPQGAVIDENTLYYWFVRVKWLVAGEEFLWPSSLPGDATVWSFWVNSRAEYPTAPSPLINPTDQELITNTGTPEFQWTAATDPDPCETVSYEVRYSSSLADFNNNIYTTSNTANTHFTPSTALIDNVTYWWSIASVDSSSVTYRAYSSTRTFVMSYLDEIPYSFDLQLPVDTTTIFDLTPTLRWYETSDPDPGDAVTKYVLWYSKDINFPAGDRTIVNNITTTYYTIPSNLIVQTTYYWFVQAFDYSLDHYTISHATFSFYTNNHPPNPFKIIKSSGIVETQNPPVEWEVSTDSDTIYGDQVTYTVLWAQNLIDLGTPSGSSQGGIPTTTFNIPSLLENATYYWTVRAVDQNNFWQGTSTETLRINQFNEKPNTFPLTSPAGVINDATPTFLWQYATDPDPGDTLTYTVMYDNRSDFTTAVSSSDIHITSFTVQSPLNEDTTYWWKVYAVDSHSAQRISNSTFTIIINAENQPPQSFDLQNPPDGDIQPTRNPIFWWDPAVDNDPGDVLTYTIYYSSDVNFLDPAPTSHGGLADPTYTPATELQENATYWWYVKVTDALGAYNFSTSTFSCVVNQTNEYPVSFNLLSPASGVEVHDITPTLDWESSYDPDPASYVRYKLFISKYSNFSASTTIGGLEISEYTFPADLDDNTVYYWKVSAVDNSGNVRNSNQTNWSFILNQGDEPPVSFNLVQPINNVVVTTLKPFFDWDDAQDPDPYASITYRLIYSPDPQLTILTTEITPLSVSSFTAVLSLVEQTSYYWTVFASDDDGFEVQAVSTGTFFIEAQNSPPAAFSLTSPIHNVIMRQRTIDFTWESSSDSDYNDEVFYQLLIGDNSQFTSCRSFSNLSDTHYTVSEGFYENRTYYWKVVAYDKSNATRDSDQTWSFFIPVIDIPKQPVNVKGNLSADWNNFTITWNQVTSNEDNSEYSDPGGYNIYRSQRLKNLSSAPLYAHVEDGIQSYDDNQVYGSLYYYFIKAIDSSGNESKQSMITSATPGESMIVLSDDGDVYLLILAAPDDERLINYYFEIECLDEQENSRVIGAYRVKAFRIDTDEEVQNYGFPVKSTINFYYSSMIQQAQHKSPELHYETDDVGIFWHNGVEYVKCGGTVNRTSGLISLNTKKLGTYRLQQVIRATDFELSQIWPTKTFTPNGDGIYDEINFQFANPKESIVTGKIFDITGGFVANMTQGINGDWSMQWDGRDNSGNYVKKGVYIYQIEVEGRVINGTIIVAK